MNEESGSGKEKGGCQKVNSMQRDSIEMVAVLGLYTFRHTAKVGHWSVGSCQDMDPGFLNVDTEV